MGETASDRFERRSRRGGGSVDCPRTASQSPAALEIFLRGWQADLRLRRKRRSGSVYDYGVAILGVHGSDTALAILHAPQETSATMEPAGNLVERNRNSGCAA